MAKKKTSTTAVEMEKKKNIILFIGKVYTEMIAGIRKYEEEVGEEFRIAVIHDSRQRMNKKTLERLQEGHVIIISCDTSSMISMQKALNPYRDELLAVTCRGEDQMPLFAKCIPHVPYLKTPTQESLSWSTNKLFMRRRLILHNKKITPAYSVANDTTKKTIDKIERKVGYPLVVKPTGLAASRLVTICYHREEMEKALKRIFRQIKKVHKDTGGTGEATVLVEQFMDGKMYSIDGYVTARGTVTFTPMFQIKTGREIGFDDFFGYLQMTPTTLSPKSIEDAQHVAREAIHAVGLRNCSAHVELMKTEKGWKVIELGARVGGFRHRLYELTKGINHTMNDILNRIPNKKPIMRKKVLKHAAAMKFFAKKEGKLTKLTGIKKVQQLDSFVRINIQKKVGDSCKFAKNGGSSVFNIVLANKDRSKLLADIRRVEQTIDIRTK